MSWPDTVPSLRGTKRRSNLIYPKEGYIWVQARILHETDMAIIGRQQYESLDPKITDTKNKAEE